MSSLFEMFCRERRLDRTRLATVWRVNETTHHGRPALCYPTRIEINRIKYLDGCKPKYAWEKTGGSAHWYGMGEARRLAAGRDLVFLGNGEPGIWAMSEAGVPTVCTCGGEGTPPSPAMVAELRDAGFRRVRVIFDRDDEGRNGARLAVEALRAGGLEAVALELPANLGEHGDVDDLHRRVREGLAEALASLPQLEVPKPEPAPPDPVSALAELTPEACRDGRLERAMRAFGEAVARLDAIGVATGRERAIARLKDLGVSAPAKVVDAALPKPQAVDDPVGAGSPLTLSDPDPWREPVQGDELLGGLVKIVRRFVVMAREQALAIALWALFTFLHDAFTISPLLGVSSPEKRCGKTRLLEVLGALVRRPLFASNITPAAVFRAVEAYSPTLILDEAETYIRGDNEDLRGILNSGHSKATAFVARTVGDDHDVRLFRTFCPKVAALIGDLPSTLEDRSIAIRLRRKTPTCRQPNEVESF
ncbi:MAG: hypothetical protein ABR961_14370 [Thermoanaerobaculaceae bacterium]|jgi:hypothetical protein